jgi:GNAT acetyltransferase, Mec-17
MCCCNAQTFLRESGKTAAMLAYDRPSPKLKSFLAKHYGKRIAVGPCAQPCCLCINYCLDFKTSCLMNAGLVAYQPQINNYVVSANDPLAQCTAVVKVCGLHVTGTDAVISCF